jgi:hypothetical protein
MFRFPMHWRWSVALLAVVAGVADAQTAAPPSMPPRAPDPTQAQAEVPAALHRSAFVGYRRHADAAATAWRDANDTVTRIGGWRTYAREAAAPAASAPAGRSAP